MVFASRRQEALRSAISGGVRSEESSEDAELEEEDRVLISDFERDSFGGTILGAEGFFAGVVLVLVGLGLEGAGLDGDLGGAVLEDVAFVGADFDDFSDFSVLEDLSAFGDLSDFDGLSAFDGEGVGEDPGNAPMRFATALLVGAAFGDSAFAAGFEDEAFAGSDFDGAAFDGATFSGVAFEGAVLDGTGFGGSAFFGGALEGVLFAGVTTGSGACAGVEPPPRNACARSRTSTGLERLSGPRRTTKTLMARSGTSSRARSIRSLSCKSCP